MAPLFDTNLVTHDWLTARHYILVPIYPLMSKCSFLRSLVDLPYPTWVLVDLACGFGLSGDWVDDSGPSFSRLWSGTILRSGAPSLPVSLVPSSVLTCAVKSGPSCRDLRWSFCPGCPAAVPVVRPSSPTSRLPTSHPTGGTVTSIGQALHLPLATARTHLSKS